MSIFNYKRAIELLRTYPENPLLVSIKVSLQPFSLYPRLRP